MTPQAVRRKIYFAFVGLFLCCFLFVTHIQTSVHAAKTDYINQKDGFVAHTSIRAGEIWKGTETSLQGRYMDAITLKITEITPGQPRSINGYWNTPSLIFFGHEGTYAQTPHDILADVIKIWGRSPIDRYITFGYTGYWIGSMIEEKNGTLKGIEEEQGGDGEYYKFVLNKASPTHTKRQINYYKKYSRYIRKDFLVGMNFPP